MNVRAISTIVLKDLKVARQNKNVRSMTIILIVFFFVLAPWLTALIPSAGDSISGVDKLFSSIPAHLPEFVGLSVNQMLVVYLLKYQLVPFFLLLPLMTALTICADSFAGEKERKTMEALLYTPTTDRELFIAKGLSGWLAAMAVTVVGFVLYIINANAAAWPQMHRIFLPDIMWLVLVLWVVPAIAALGVGAMVLVSSRAEGFQDATQLGAIVVLPIIGLFYIQLAGVLFLDVIMMILMGIVMWLFGGVLIWLGSRTFHRGRLLGA